MSGAEGHEQNHYEMCQVHAERYSGYGLPKGMSEYKSWRIIFATQKSRSNAQSNTYDKKHSVKGLVEILGLRRPSIHVLLKRDYDPNDRLSQPDSEDIE